jgi:DNA polymerase elongation subunit (family B)
VKVVYGHTDSIYVQIDSVEKAQNCIKEIEASVREHFPNILGLEQHPVVLEFEKYYSALGVGTTKNRNAGMITWEDGVWLDEPKFTMTGFTAKRVSVTQLEKEVQTETLKLWVNNKSMSEITKYLHSMYNEVLQGKIDKTLLIKRSRLKEARFMVQCQKCKRKYHLNDITELNVCGENEGRAGTHKCGNAVSNFLTIEQKNPSIGSGIAGVLYCWQKKNISFDDSYLFLKVKGVNDYYTHPLTKEKREVEYMAGNINTDFDNYTPDWEHYAEQVLKKAKPIYESMGWDISSIRSGRIQTSLTEWF